MKGNSTYYIDLITRHFSGELPEDELRILSDWLKADIRNRELFGQYHKTWLLVEKQRIQASVDPEKEWNAFQLKIASETSDGKLKENPFTLNRNSRKSFFTGWKIAAILALLIGFSFLLYKSLDKPNMVTVVAKAENIEQVLPDGTLVSLHSGSQISYPEKFTGLRNVELKGEAYFKVFHDRTKPFIVASGNARVEVLGTQFNVNAKPVSGNMEVILTSGKVSVYYIDKPKENVLLSPGEKAELIAGQKIIRKTINTDPNYLAWKTHLLIFENEPLSQVIGTLQNVYQIPVALADQQLTNYRVTASFKDQSLQSVLEVLKETLDLQITDTGKNIKIEMKPEK